MDRNREKKKRYIQRFYTYLYIKDKLGKFKVGTIQQNQQRISKQSQKAKQ